MLVTGGSRYAQHPQAGSPATPHQNTRITKAKSRGLGALIAEKFAAEGCNVAIKYVSNLERAKETAEKIEREYQAKTVIVQGVGCF